MTKVGESLEKQRAGLPQAGIGPDVQRATGATASDHRSVATGNASLPRPNSRDEAAERLRQTIHDPELQRQRTERLAAAEKREQLGRIERQQRLLEEHGLRLQLGGTGFSTEHELQLKKRLETLTAHGGLRGDTAGNVRIAFIEGDQDKIDAAIDLHRQGLLDLNAQGDDGDSLAHAVARTRSEPRHAELGQHRPPTVTLAQRFALLKDAGVDIDCCNLQGQTPIAVALSLSGAALAPSVVALLTAGVNLRGRRKSNEPLLHVAARSSSLEAIKLLLEQGADLHALARDGGTALHVAARHGTAAVVRTLLEHGASTDAKTADRRTALQIAAERNAGAVVDVLREFQPQRKKRWGCF